MDRLALHYGRWAVSAFNNLINEKTDFGAFIKELQDLLVSLKIGILRVEKSDLDNMKFTLAVAEDLDCSGLPVCEETICTYDECQTYAKDNSDYNIILFRFHNNLPA